MDISLNGLLAQELSLYVQGRNITRVLLRWLDSPPGLVGGQSRTLRQYQEYGANWNFVVKGAF